MAKKTALAKLKRHKEEGTKPQTPEERLEQNRRSIAKANKIPFEQRARYANKAEQDEGQRQHSLRYMRKRSAYSREIGPFPLTPVYIDPDKGRKTKYTLPPHPLLGEYDLRTKGPDAPTVVSPKDIQRHGLVQVEGINWERRIACKASLKLTCETYFKPIFYMEWSQDQLICLAKAELVVGGGGKFALAMPRGGGKTAICRAATIWGAMTGRKHFIFNIGSTEPKSEDTLGFVQTSLSYNPMLHQDYPELCWPVIHLQGTNRTAGGQLFMGEPTHVRLGADEIVFPCIILPPEIAAYYREHDSESILHVEHLQADIPSNSVVLLRASGIGGSIRGEADTHPVTLEQPRPDLVLLDDVQKDSIADSPLMCEKLVRLIDGAVTGLAGPDAHIDALMPCTVSREGDASDTYVNPLLKPEWQGERCAMVKSWPEGVTDFEIEGGENAPQAAQLWNQYAELRRTSLRDLGTIQNATLFYSRPENRQVMDRGFVVSWQERFDKRSEVSAQQHAMNLRLQLGQMFLSEYQNIGRKLIDTSDILITAKQLMGKVVDVNRREMAPSHQIVVTHIDIQNEIFFYLTLATDMDFNATFIDYGTWPEVHMPYFTKAQTESWSLLTNEFFKAYPEHKGKAIRASSGKTRAPLEAKIYHGLSKFIPILLERQYKRTDTTGRLFTNDLIGIDTRWGQASEVIKRYIRESGHQKLVPYYGQAFPPTNNQLEQYEMRDGWLFEQQVNPLVREPKWVMRPNASDGTWYLAADVNRLKDFLFSRFSVPLGAPGCFTLHKAPAEYHELFVNHICSSEYPEPVAARGITKNMWQVRAGSAYDNDWLDCACGCVALAGLKGVSIKTSDFEVKPIRRRLSDVRADKQRRRDAAQKVSTQRER